MNSIIYLKGEKKMDEEIKKLLDGEIKAEIQNLSNMEDGSDEKSLAVENLVKLFKVKIDASKNERDLSDKKDQFGEQIKDRYFRLGIAAAELILPLIFYGIWMRKGFKFEETGTYTSTTFKGLFNRFRPSKK